MVNNMLALFRSFRTILCVCPHCDEVQRLSDLQIRYAGKAGKTWLDNYDTKVKSLEKKDGAFADKEEELREAARERGRRQVPVILKNLIHTELTTQPYDPYDIKALLHPVDFVVFNGMNKNNVVKEITFLSRKAENRALDELRASIRTTINKGSYNWQVARVDVNGNVTYASK
jgi:predicted Holliday junction resolvase-like endonuclease